jgi:hypothetical protein
VQFVFLNDVVIQKVEIFVRQQLARKKTWPAKTFEPSTFRTGLFRAVAWSRVRPAWSGNDSRHEFLLLRK